MAAFVAGCSVPAPTPRLTEVSPAWGYNGETTDITLLGTNFLPTVVVQAQDGEAHVEGTFEAWLVGEETEALTGVQLVDYGTLVAEVPPELPPGPYAVRLDAPSGQSTTLEDAFTVTSTRADHLAIELGPVGFTVGDYATVDVQLLDPADLPVALPIQVTVTAESINGLDGIKFHQSGLAAAGSSDGKSVTGWLDASGTGRVVLTSSLPDDVAVTIAPTDPTSPVRAVSQTYSWDAGDVAQVTLVLPDDPLVVTAGEPFDLGIQLRDEFGNLLPDVSTTLVLADDCGSYLDPGVNIVGEGTVSVTITETCASDRIIAYALTGDFVSDTFTVKPGEAIGYSILAGPSSVTAGITPLAVFVTAVDVYGNMVEDHEAQLLLYDDAGGLDPDLNLGTQACPGFNGDGFQLCQATLWAASPGTVIRAVDDEGRVGYSQPIEVIPDDPSILMVLSSGTPAAAGDPFTVDVRVTDDWGNSTAFEPTAVAFSDDTGTLACEYVGPGAGTQGFSCTIEAATADAHVSAEVLGLAGTCADPVEITNADLEDVEVEPQGESFVAGTPFSLNLRAFDVYGNPYILQADPNVDLSDGSATFTPGFATLGATGEVLVTATIRSAGESVRIHASQGGVELGTSRPIAVTAAAQDGFTVNIPPWVDVDEPGTAVVTAVDAYGNPILDYTGTVTLTADNGACSPMTVTDFTNGTAMAQMSCSTPTFSEVFRAADTAGYTGESDTFDVVDLACADGPTAAVLLDGGADTMSCVGATTADVDVDASGSVAGASAILLYHYDDGSGTTERSLVSSTTFTYDSPGARYIEALVVDSRGCADTAGAYAWIGPDDGGPTGEVTVTPSTAGPVDSLGTLTVTVAATDCTGDVAAGQTLLVRADLGEPAGTPTGSGLEITLGASGTATFDWSMVSGQQGTATIHVGTADGAAYGTGSVTVDNDIVHPHVVSMTPSGVELGTVSTVEVLFNEPMYPDNLSSSVINLSGPGGTRSATYALSSDLRTLIVTPTTPIDGSAGVWTLALSSNVRDNNNGNKLDGGWSGPSSSGPFTNTFGAVSEALPTGVACTASVTRFVPDGDDGTDEEADTVNLTVAASASPTWWWFQVTSAEGDRVRSEREPGTTGSISWNGRADDGLLADRGRYTLTISPVDSYGNVGEECDVYIELDQNVVAP